MKRTDRNICPLCDAGDPTSVVTECDCEDMTLQDLTSQESGIVIYHPQGQALTAYVLNWTSVAGLPAWLGPIGPLSIQPVPAMRRRAWRGLGPNLRDVARRACQQAQQEGRGPHPIGRGAHYWQSDEVTVIAPRDWN